MSVQARPRAPRSPIDAREVVADLVSQGYRGDRLARAALRRLPKDAPIAWDTRDPVFALTYEPVHQDGGRLSKSAIRVDFVYQLIGEVGGSEALRNPELDSVEEVPVSPSLGLAQVEPPTNDKQKYVGRPANVTRRSDLDEFSVEEIVHDLMGVVKDRALVLEERSCLRPGGPVSIDDLIQEGVIALIEAIPTFRDDRGARFATFVRVVVYHAMVDFLRATMPDDWDVVPLSEGRPEPGMPDFVDDLALWLDTREALVSVPHAAAWYERWLTGRPVKDLAADWGEKPNTVTRRLERARRHLVSALGMGDRSPGAGRDKPRSRGQAATIHEPAPHRPESPIQGAARPSGFPPLYPDPTTVDEPNDVVRVGRLVRRMNYDGRYRINFFEDGHRVHYLQFITPTTDLISLSMMEQVAVGWENPLQAPSVPVYANLGWQSTTRGSAADGLKKLFERFDDPPAPRLKTLAVAVLLEPVQAGGFRVSHHPGLVAAEGSPWPRIGLVVQARMNFWDPLLRQCQEVSGHVFRVKRSGVKLTRWFDFTAVAPAIDIEIDTRRRVDLARYAQEITSRDRAEALLQPLPGDWSFR